MSDGEILERTAAGLLMLWEEQELKFDREDYAHYLSELRRMGTHDHHGDCPVAEQKGPWGCSRCHYEQFMDMARVAVGDAA